jgi:hypothetical protein
MEQAQLKQPFNLEQFRSLAEPAMWEQIYGIEGDSLMCCHVKTYRETGVWLEELVPVFQKLDAARNVGRNVTQK